MILSLGQRRVRDLQPGDVLDIAPHCGPGLDCQGVRVTALPHASGETADARVDGQRTTRDLWRVPAVCASCGTPFFKLELAHVPVRLQREAAPRG
jgi:hypothetical protein